MHWKLLLPVLLASLAACDGGQQPSPAPSRPATPTARAATPQPTWLEAAPACDGALRRGAWLLCDNKTLNALHRALASQWARERQGADRQRLEIQRRQLDALRSERDVCETADCVATTYRRYLDAHEHPAPAPGVTPPPSRPLPVREPSRAERPDWRDNGPGCATEAGWQQAALLARQCSVVDPDGECEPQRSCRALKAMISEGCYDMGESGPGFCRRP